MLAVAMEIWSLGGGRWRPSACEALWAEPVCLSLDSWAHIVVLAFFTPPGHGRRLQDVWPAGKCVVILPGLASLREGLCLVRQGETDGLSLGSLEARS